MDQSWEYINCSQIHECGNLKRDHEVSFLGIHTWDFRYSVMLELGLGTEFHSEKIPRNRLGTVSVIPRKKVLIPRHSEFRGRANSEAQDGTEGNEIPRKKKYDSCCRHGRTVTL